MLYLGDQELDSEGLLSCPECKLHHKTFDTLEDEFCTLQTPLHCHVLITRKTNQLQGAQLR